MRLIAILDNIRSVHNVGSIFRTADALGVEKIYCCGITPGPVDRFKNVRADFAKVALGAEKSVAWETAKDIVEIIGPLKDEGWQIFAIEQAEGSRPYSAYSPNSPRSEDGPAAADGQKESKIVLILGTETTGIDPSILRLADEILEIPMRGKKESLNVAVAFGIVGFALRQASDPAPKLY